jgi:hypothetical protein
MHRFQVLLAIVSLGLVVSVGHALADGPSAGFSGEKVAQVSFIDRALNLIQLSDGMELRAPDQRMLTTLVVGEWVKVDFVSDGERVMLNSITPAQPDEMPAAAGGNANRSGVIALPVVATAARTSDVAVYLARLGRRDRRTAARRERAPDQGARWRLVADRLPTDREVTHR